MYYQIFLTRQVMLKQKGYDISFLKYKYQNKITMNCIYNKFYNIITFQCGDLRILKILEFLIKVNNVLTI